MTTTSSDATPATPAENSRYQQLRAHLTTLKLLDAAEALPAVLDQARTENLTMTAALERLLRIEVTANQARRLAGRLRFACLPNDATLEDLGAAPHEGGFDRRCRW
jgi:DNA replication protein DnaC